MKKNMTGTGYLRSERTYDRSIDVFGSATTTPEERVAAAKFVAASLDVEETRAVLLALGIMDTLDEDRANASTDSSRRPVQQG